MKYLVKLTRIPENTEEEPQELFEVFYAETLEEISEALEQEEEDYLIDYAVPYHPVHARLLAEFGVEAVDGAISFLLGFEVEPSPEIVVHVLLMGQRLIQEGIADEDMDEAEQYIQISNESESQEIAGPVDISTRGRFQIN
jgi:hypothetical protein